MSAMAHAQRCRDAAQVALDDALSNKAARDQELAAKVEFRRSAMQALEAARDAYRDDPSDANAALIDTARRNEELAALATDRPREAVERAGQTLATAQTGLQSAETQVREAEREIHLARQREIAKPTNYHSRTEGTWERIVALVAELGELGESVAREWERSLDAAAESGLQPPSYHQQIVPLVRLLVAEDDSILPGILLSVGNSVSDTPDVLDVRRVRTLDAGTLHAAITTLRRAAQKNGVVSSCTDAHRDCWRAVEAATTERELFTVRGAH